MLYTLRFFLQNALFKFYIQGVLKLKKNNSGAKGLICLVAQYSFPSTSASMERFALLCVGQTNLLPNRVCPA